MRLVNLFTLLRSTDDELDILERYITNELPSGIYSFGIRADSAWGLAKIGLGHVATHN